MSKIIFDKEETKNLINMLRSSDADNHTIAFEALKNVNIKRYIGELIVMYKFSGHSKNTWSEQCPNIFKKLEKVIVSNGGVLESLTSPQTLAVLTKVVGSSNSIELFMEYFVKNMTNVLEGIGYPIDKFEITIKLKDNG
jgi:ABC-type ATPase with predicted acetyltransferase domain